MDARSSACPDRHLVAQHSVEQSHHQGAPDGCSQLSNVRSIRHSAEVDRWTPRRVSPGGHLGRHRAAADYHSTRRIAEADHWPRHRAAVGQVSQVGDLSDVGWARRCSRQLDFHVGYPDCRSDLAEPGALVSADGRSLRGVGGRTA